MWSRDHDWTKKDGEVSHAVCGKTEHPSYSNPIRWHNDIAILKLCKPLMFTEGKLSKHNINYLELDLISDIC